MTTPSNPAPLPEAPPAKVVLLPDASFFVRVVPVTPAATPADVAAQCEVALEALSPFPPAQLYHGYFHAPGAGTALVFAAYRRRFPREETEAWADADLVIPAFATILGGATAPSTTVLIWSEAGLTAVHRAADAVPAGVYFRPLTAEASDEQRDALRAEVLRAVGGTQHVVELPAPPQSEATNDENEYAFRAADRTFHITAAVAATLDVRDKADLATLRRSRARDVLLWRAFLGCAAAVAVIAIAWAGLYAGGFWQRTRQMKLTAQQPVVDQVMTAQSLTTRINELSTKRLLPLEMISAVIPAKPASVQFRTATTDGLYTLRVEAQTMSPGEVSTFRSAIADLPVVQSVEVRDQRTRDNVMTFMLVVTFRPEVLKPAAPS